MRFPSKVTSFNDSILSKFPVVLNELKKQDIKPFDLYEKVKKKLDGINEFVDIIDCLYVLDMIELNGEVLHYAKKY